MLNSEIKIREAKLEDISKIQEIRRSVKENVLSDPTKVTDERCHDYLVNRGKGWVSLCKQIITGFCIVDLISCEAWALFVHPNFERRGIGTLLQQEMLDYYFALRNNSLFLSTEPNTRAEKFYTQSGWVNIGVKKNGEIQFEMTYANYSKTKGKL